MTDEPQIGELSSDELEQVGKDAIRADRISLFKQIEEEIVAIEEALRDLPYWQAEPMIGRCHAVLDIISDPLGDHFGTCELCEDPIFVRGQPDDDVETGPEEGTYAHRTCMDRLRKEKPEMFRRVSEDEDGE